MKKIPLAAVIGAPIAHSKSPKLHGHWLEANAISGHYVPLHIEPEDFSTAVRNLHKLGFVGANVTIPHKEAALEISDEQTPRAQKMGAANTLIFKDGKIIADNTDGIGFIENVKANSDWSSKSSTALIGAGGAARAVVCALIDEGVPKIFISNRTRKRAQNLREEFGESIEVVDWDRRAEMLEGVGLLVNTSSLGMIGKPPLDLDLSALPKSAVVNDLVYTPLETQLLAQAKTRGNETVDGLGMLIHQAIPGFEAWFGIRPKITDELRNILLK